MTADYQRVLEAYIAATRAGDVDAYARCLSPEVTFFGSLTGARLHGIGPVRGAFTAGAALIGFQHIRAFEVHGYGAEIALITPIQRPQDVEPLGFLTLIRMDAQGLVYDIRLLWDPRRALLDLGAGEPPVVRPEVGAFFRHYNEGELEAALAMLAPEVRYFGTIVGQASMGVATVRGILASARDTLGITRLEPLQVFGRGDHLGVLAAFTGRGGALSRGVLGLSFDDRGRISELSTLWDPRPFLEGREG